MGLKLDNRLFAAASFAIPGKRFADVGTDHAYLPIYLCENGLAPGGVASDINEGPIKRATANIAKAGLSDKIKTVQTDGLNGLDIYAPEEIFILGMGGELIASIIEKSDLARAAGVSLILQPMTRAAALRKALDDYGFRTVDESIIRSGLRFYQVINAEYDGMRRESSMLELEIGKQNLLRSGPAVMDYCECLKKTNCKRISGLRKAGLDCEKEEQLMTSLIRYTDKKE